MPQIAEYLSKQGLPDPFVVEYLNQFELWLQKALLEFPESGMELNDYGQGIRKVCCKKYSFVYRVTGSQIEILTVFRDNLP